MMYLRHDSRDGAHHRRRGAVHREPRYGRRRGDQAVERGEQGVGGGSAPVRAWRNDQRRRLDRRQRLAPRLAPHLAERAGRGGFSTRRCSFSSHGLRHHSVLAWLQVPSSSTIPSSPRRSARRVDSGSPRRSSSAELATFGRSASAAPSRDTAPPSGAARPARRSARARFGHDSPTASFARRQRRGDLAARSTAPRRRSCGCCRTRTKTRLSIGSGIGSISSLRAQRNISRCLPLRGAARRPALAYGCGISFATMRPVPASC